VQVELWLARVAQLVRFGPAAGLVAVVKRFLSPWLELGTIVVFELPLRRCTVAPGLEVRLLHGPDVALVAAAFGRRPEVFARRLARGDRGYCVFVEDEPLHMRWVTTRPTAIPEVGLWLRPAAGTVYVYDVETRAPARGRRLAGLARAAMDDSLAAEGFHAKVAYIRGDNHAMWRSVRDAPGPLRRLCRVGYVRRPGSTPHVLGRPRWPLTAVPPPPSKSSSAIV
jgi:hypothetical protein